jgi:hypothetical protein
VTARTLLRQARCMSRARARHLQEARQLFKCYDPNVTHILNASQGHTVIATFSNPSQLLLSHVTMVPLSQQALCERRW